MSKKKEIVEINGIKFEVDLNSARKITEFKIGEHVKVLIKDYSSYKSHIGVIVGFDNFKSLPSINIAYLEKEYSSTRIKFITFNEKSEDIEVAPLVNPNEFSFSESSVIEAFDAKILSAQEALRIARAQKEYFVEAFGKYFNQTKTGNDNK